MEAFMNKINKLILLPLLYVSLVNANETYNKNLTCNNYIENQSIVSTLYLNGMSFNLNSNDYQCKKHIYSNISKINENKINDIKKLFLDDKITGIITENKKVFNPNDFYVNVYISLTPEMYSTYFHNNDDNLKKITENLTPIAYALGKEKMHISFFGRGDKMIAKYDLNYNDFKSKKFNRLFNEYNETNKQKFSNQTFSKKDLKINGFAEKPDNETTYIAINIRD